MTIGHPSRTRIIGFRGWRALRHRNFRLFFGGQLVSLVGTWMQAVAQAWLVLELTGSPVALGLVAAAQFGPVLVLGLFGGLIADGLPKRQTLIATQVVAMILALILFALTATGAVQVGHILVLALLLGCVNAVEMPTRQSFVVEIVGRDDVANAVGLNSAVFNGARIIGPAVAGLTIGATDISIAFLVNGLSFLGTIVAYLAMDGRLLHPAPRLGRPTTVRGVAASLAEGLRYVRTTPLVLLAVLVVGLVSLFGMNFSVVIPALARDVLGVGATGFGFLMAAMGVGSMVGAISVAFSRRSRPAIIALGGLALGLAEVVLAASGSYSIALLAMVVAGLGGISMAATGNTTIQLTVPDHLRGRVMSVYTTVFVGSTPVGGLIAGAVAGVFGVPFAVALGGAGSAVVGLAGLAWYRRLRARMPALTLAAAAAPVPARTATVTEAPPISPVLPVDMAAEGGREAARRSTVRG